MKDESQNSEVENREDASGTPSENPVAEVDPSRRRLAKAGMAAPVLVTLAGRPVFGGPSAGAGRCLSNQMSGNLSQDILSCQLGDGPDTWSSPDGNILGVASASAWASIGYGTVDQAYGTLIPGEAGTDCSHFTGGEILGNTSIGSHFAPSEQAKPLRQILCEPANPVRNCVAALLNARYSALNPSDFRYVMDETHVGFYCSSEGDYLVDKELGFPSADAFFLYTFATS